MPFEQCIPRNFTVGEIQSYAPKLAGVYGISNPHEWIYIGVSENIQSALLVHLQDANTSVTNPRATGFVYEVCDGARRLTRQDRLVFEYEPSENRRTSR
ncbi:hypothetical protein [Bryobacter aggregatus]|uniref:hypothetical protein n=1 Tax=Bryobacter aggregatus TaxID=360054 RepID=UPI0012BA7CC3|nr:hypothetical protein [Bryobacter aggregatus]